MKKTPIKSIALALAATAGLAIGTAQALTTTQTFDLGTSPASTNFPTTGVSSLIVWIPKGSLPPGSILRSVTANNLKLEAQQGNSWASDLGVFIDPTPETPGGDGLLKIGDDNNYGGSANAMGWGGGQGDGPYATLSRTEANWTPAIDLHDAAVMLGNGWADNTAYSGTITVEYDASEPAVILNFGPGATVGALVANAANIAWTVPYGTDVTTLAPTFTLSSGTCDKDNGGPTTYDFSSPVTYTVTDGATVNTYTVTVTVTPASSNKEILTFGPYAIISGTNIAWTVPYGTDVTTLSPTYTVSPFASGSPVSGTTRDFTNPQNYTITAQDGSTQDYTVTVTVAPDETTVIWDVAGSGAWDLGTPNWEGQASGLPTTFSNGDNVIFDNTAGGTISIAPGMVPLTTDVSASSGTYIFSGQPIGSGSLTKSGGGTLRLNVTPANFSSIAVSGGTLFLNAADGFAPDSVLFNIPNVTVESGASLVGYRMHAQGGTLTMNGGRYYDFNGFSGRWAGPVYLASDSFFGSDGVAYALQIFGAISGPGGFTYSSGTGAFLGLFNANSYQGPTNVTSGAMACLNSGSLGNTSALSIASGAKVLLAYTGDQVVTSLILGGATMPAGTYGSSVSAAPVENQLDTYFATAGKVYFEDYTGTGTVTVVGSTPYIMWADGTFANGTLSDKNPASDPDGDSQTNQEEFAFGLDPTSGASVNPISQQLDKTTGVFKYTRTKDSGLTYIYQSSTTLSDPWDVFTPDSAISNNATPVEEITVTVPPSLLSGSKLFLRVKAQ